jgi:hypothetical protein
VDKTFSKAGETKNTVKFQEDTEPHMVGQQYVQKPAYEELGKPEKITVTIEVAS